jgi:hypothetical protein
VTTRGTAVSARIDCYPGCSLPVLMAAAAVAVICA